MLCWKKTESWNFKVLICWEKMRPENPDVPFDMFPEILNTGPISIKKHEMEILENLEYGVNLLKSWY